MKLFGNKKNKDKKVKDKKEKQKKSFFGFFKKSKKNKNYQPTQDVQTELLDNNAFESQQPIEQKIFLENTLPENSYSKDLNDFDNERIFLDTKAVKNEDLIKETLEVSALRNEEDESFKKDDLYFQDENNEVYYEQNVSPVETYGVPFEIAYDNKETIEKNLSYDAIYTETDLKNFGLPEDLFLKFFKNGSVFYKLKKEGKTEDEISVYTVFKKDTKFSDSEDEEFKKQAYLEKLKEAEFFSKWDDDFEINEILGNNLDDSEERLSLKEKIYNLNKEIENKIERLNKVNIVDGDIGELIYTRQYIEQKQEEIKDKIYELKENFSNSNIFYKVKNLFFNTWDEDDIYFGYRLENISFDVYPNDRIVIVSDNSITNQLLVDVLKGDELKTAGYVYKNVWRKNQWVDASDLEYNYSKINNVDLNDELLYGLTSPDYLSFGIKNKRKDNVGISMQRIFKSLGVSPEDKIRDRLIELMRFESQLNKNLFELDDLNLEKFYTICDILINKKMILIKSICQGMSFNEKMELLNFLNKYFATNNITAIYASDDLNDVNLFATKVMVIKQGQLMSFKSFDQILKEFNSVNEFVIHHLKYGVVKEYDVDKIVPLPE
ncbi:hypothetical protein D8X55_00700 [Malacoplasma penetrans]|uniref:hypothetical protein n=1 Tax=Malacoplasma penetrans TaxID=28227 RepID=UPI001011A676|nr:hypothetical protein [Malacoplasma penetrans]RXY97205.1 hypothetical protein D8X55_00700 [Malacoplasma penetrans]